MKKRIVFLLILMLLLVLVSCGDKEDDVIVNPDPIDNTNEEVTLLNPIMESWEIFNPNGFNTLVVIMSNPNDTPIDVAYDLVFYKDNEEVSRIETCLTEVIMEKEKHIAWFNYDIPNPSECDDIKMENVSTLESYYVPVKGTYEDCGLVDNEHLYKFSFESQPTMASIYFLVYNDYNNNDKYDVGEMEITIIESLFNGEDELSLDYDLLEGQKVEVYISAYKE